MLSNCLSITVYAVFFKSLGFRKFCIQVCLFHSYRNTKIAWFYLKSSCHFQGHDIPYLQIFLKFQTSDDSKYQILQD